MSDVATRWWPPACEITWSCSTGCTVVQRLLAYLQGCDIPHSTSDPNQNPTATSVLQWHIAVLTLDSNAATRSRRAQAHYWACIAFGEPWKTICCTRFDNTAEMAAQWQKCLCIQLISSNFSWSPDNSRLILTRCEMIRTMTPVIRGTAEQVPHWVIDFARNLRSRSITLRSPSTCSPLKRCVGWSTEYAKHGIPFTTTPSEQNILRSS